jgi:hypothetical protein
MGSRSITRTYVPSDPIFLNASDQHGQSELAAIAASFIARTDSQSLAELASLNGSGELVQPTGAAYTRYQDLAGTGYNAKVANAAANQIISFPTGNVTVSDFANYTDGIYNAFLNTKGGISGTGYNYTTFNMVAGSSTRASLVPSQAAGGTNQIYVFHFNDTNGLVLENFGVNGTDQGHLHNGMRMHQCANATIKNIRLNGIAPGDYYYQPGETFGIGTYGGDNHYYENVIIDGMLNGVNRGASAFGANGVGGTDGVKGYTYKNCWGNSCQYSASFALWQAAGTHWLIGCGSTGGNRTNLNLERCGQEVYRGSSTAQCTINVVDYTFGSVLAAGQDIFYGNDRGRTYLNIYDPIGRNASSKIKVYYPANEQGNPNIAQMGDIKVYTGGTWSGGSPGVGTYTGGTDVSATYLNFTGSGV